MADDDPQDDWPETWYAPHGIKTKIVSWVIIIVFFICVVAMILLVVVEMIAWGPYESWPSITS